MTSLAEVYEGKVGEAADLRRLYLGVGTFLVGSLLAAAGIVVVGTQSGNATLEAIRDARWLAGILAGVGVPAVFLGVFAVLPAGRVTRAAAVVGAGVSLLGVSLFAHAYPCHWAGAPCASTDLTLPTLGVYFLGVVTTFWCLFVGVANFKSRNDPGGTVELEVTRGGETKTIEVSRSKLDANDETPSGGGVGFFGETPDGNVETQTNRSPEASLADDALTDGAAGSGLSDGGATREQITGLTDDELTPNDPGGPGSSTGPNPSTSNAPRGGTGRSGNVDSLDSVGSRGSSGPGISTPNENTPGGSGPGFGASGGTARDDRSAGGDSDAGSPADSYCGSCAHFQYVRTDEGMQPYCGYHDEVMDDMDACEEWTPR